ncbi:outer membrane receptor protein [Clostridium sp. SY8519]|uniref:hypothetical protein n=1 Tax=Clostridium sp. (strain SY8519) TaxID=1042156 RepID=UPI0002172028|nr:hypothetical protein [Clostridium sp. SY8519]BAK46747.1 outer membrane receptor protein [Clostridium sp. SY8519]
MTKTKMNVIIAAKEELAEVEAQLAYADSLPDSIFKQRYHQQLQIIRNKLTNTISKCQRSDPA